MTIRRDTAVDAGDARSTRRPVTAILLVVGFTLVPA